MSEEEKTIAVEEPAETAESLQAQIEELSKKLAKATEVEEEEHKLDLIDVPLADAEVFMTKGHSVAKRGLTPAEVLILSAMHHVNVGDVPVKNIRPGGWQTEEGKAPEFKPGLTIKVDPLELRNKLANKYGAERVLKLFPGNEPKFPKTFARALTIGVGTILPQARMFDHKLEV